MKKSHRNPTLKSSIVVTDYYYYCTRIWYYGDEFYDTKCAVTLLNQNRM